MKKNISFDKSIEFPTMIGEINAISLEKELQFVDESTVEGFFLVTGKYKITEASRILEDFSYKIPAEIHFTESLDLKSTNIEITDFSYDVTDGNVLNCQIELNVEGNVKEIPIDLSEETRECDGDFIEKKEDEIPTLEVKDVEVCDDAADTSHLFSIDDDKDSFGTFVVYIVRQNETINSIIEKYHTSLEEIEKYNDVNNISIGTKLIIPLLHE
jgi:hypothetical protein